MMLREHVRAGLKSLLADGRQIWGDTRHTLPEIVLRLTVGVGDLARLARDHTIKVDLTDNTFEPDFVEYAARRAAAISPDLIRELKKELGNVLFSTIRWIDDLGLDVLECLDLAIEAQEKFASSGRAR